MAYFNISLTFGDWAIIGRICPGIKLSFKKRIGSVWITPSSYTVRPVASRSPFPKY